MSHSLKDKAIEELLCALEDRNFSDDGLEDENYDEDFYNNVLSSLELIDEIR